MDLNPSIVPGGVRLPWQEKPDPMAKIEKQALHSNQAMSRSNQAISRSNQAISHSNDRKS